MNKSLQILIAFLLSSCTTNSDKALQHEWKYSEGYSAGDWLSFDESEIYKISDDTLFKQDTAVAIVIEVDKRIDGNTELTLKSLQTGELVTYHKK